MHLTLLAFNIYLTVNSKSNQCQNNPASYPFFTYSTAPSGKSHCSKQITKPPSQRLTVAEVTLERRKQIPSVFSLNMERCRMQAGLNQLDTGQTEARLYRLHRCHGTATANSKITTGSSTLESWDTTASVNTNNLFIQCCLFHM